MDKRKSWLFAKKKNDWSKNLIGLRKISWLRKSHLKTRFSQLKKILDVFSHFKYIFFYLDYQVLLNLVCLTGFENCDYQPKNES